MEPETLKDKFKQVSSLLNLAHPSNWILELPIKNLGIGPVLGDKMGYNTEIFAMNLTSFTLGRMGLKVNEITKQDYTFYVPSGTETTEKIFTCNYTLSSGFQQYYFLTRWWQKNLSINQHLSDTDMEFDGEYFLQDINLWILNEHKEPVMLITYLDAWLSELGELQLDYQNSSPVLNHSFSCYYNDYTIQIIE